MMPRANLSAGFGPDGIVPIDPTPEHCAFLFDQHLVHPDACVVVYAPEDKPEGFLMGALFAHPFDTRLRIAKETAWWVEEGCRGRLAVVNAMLDQYEAWAKGRGCRFAGMAELVGKARVGKIYERRGYAPIETHYLKPL